MTHVTLHFPGASQPVIPYIIRLAFTLTAVLLCAFVAVIVARRASAAVRHRIWSLGIAACLLLPAALALVPERRVGLVTSEFNTLPAPTIGEQSLPDAPIAHEVIATDAPLPVASTDPSRVASTPAQPRTFPTAISLLIGYTIPTFLLIARLLVGALKSRSAVRRATPLHLHTGTPVPVLESSQTQSPVCVGYFRRSILLPPTWRRWPAGQFRAVLTHELAHVARRDVLWQGLARLACAVYWPHPLTWYAARRMRIEREFACDDSVLRAGATPTLYSRWLLDLACQFKSARLGIAMASRTGLPARVEAALSTTRRRTPVSARFSAMSIVLAAIVLILGSTLSPLTTTYASAKGPVPPAAASQALQPSVLLVTEGNVYLKEMLDSLHLNSSVTMRPDEYAKLHPHDFDIVIFDRHAPASPPTAGKFIYVGAVPPHLNPPHPDITIAQDLAGNPITLSGQKVINWDHNHPLLKDISLDRLWIDKALKLNLPPDATSLVDGAKGSLIALMKDGKRTNVVIAFDLTQSNWPLDLSFPMFWHRLIQFLAPDPQLSPSTQPALTQPSAFRPQDRSIRFVAGRVTDSTGKPVPAARIFVLLSGRSFSLHTATADADGHFVLFIDLKLPQPLHLRAESPDGTDVGSLDLPRTGRLTQADLENLSIALKPAIPYPVIVTDANDRPINRVTVTAMLGPGNPIETSTDAAGKATLLLPADNPPTSIIVSKPDVGLDYFVFPRRGARAAREPVSPAPGEPIHFALNGARTVTVKVTDFLLRPLAGVNVHPRSISKPGKSPLIISANAPDSAVTDASGTAKLTVPADVDRPVTFATSFPGYVLSYNPTWDPAAPENWVTLEMKPMTRYHLAVLDPDGKPAPSADAMMVDDHGAQNYGNFQNGPVGADGKVDGFLLPDTVYMFAAMKGKLASDPVIQVVRVGAPPVRVELKLKPAVRVHGKLTAGTPPVPVANGNIYIQFDDADAYQSLPPAQRLPAGVTGPRDIHPAVMFNRPTDSEGNFEFYLAPGTYHLIDPPDLRQVVPASTTFVVPSNQPDITFDFHHKSQRPVPRQ